MCIVLVLINLDNIIFNLFKFNKKMKTFKLAIFSLAMVLMLFTSCTNDESVIEEQQTTEESESITTSLNQLRSQFDDSGNVSQSDNPAGNIVLDFCFNFVYPLNLSYNNGTTVSVADLNGLIDVMITSTDELYINGVAFPFNVETFNDSTNAIEVGTINNEDEFMALLESCEFDASDDCFYTTEAYPVCVEITDPNGNTFIITYPNASYAACDGFTEEDFAENCEEDYYSGGIGFDCFTLNYPISIVTNDGVTVIINSEEELGNVLYDVYSFDFVYPFTVTLDNAAGEIVTINSPEDIEAILTDCYGDIGGNECEECADAVYDPVCIEYTDAIGITTVITFPNMCFAECEGFTENNVVDCEDNNPGNCSEDYIESIFTECQTWEATVGGQVFNYLFNSNEGIVEIYNQNNDLITVGTWEITVDNGSGAVVMIINTNSDNFTTVWFFINCNAAGEFEITTNGGAASNISSACD